MAGLVRRSFVNAGEMLVFFRMGSDGLWDLLWAMPPVARIPHFMVYGLEAIVLRFWLYSRLVFDFLDAVQGL